MARRRTRVRFSRSMRVAAVALLAAATTTVLFEADIGRSLLLSSAMVAVAPPVLYALLALVLLRGAPLNRRLGWAVAACGVYAALGLLSGLTLSLAHPMSLEGALRRALWSFAPAPFVHLMASPLVLIAWRSRLIPVRLTVREEPGSPAARSSAAPLRSGSPDWDSVLHVSPPAARASGSSSAAAERAPRERDSGPEAPSAPRERPSTAVQRPPISQVPDPAPPPAAPSAMVATPPSVARAVTSTPPPARLAPKPSPPERPILPPVDATRKSSAPAPAPPVKAAGPEAPGGGETGPVIRVPFDRIADQLPPDVFTLPPARLAESLQEPHALLVPLRLVLPQLGEGAVEVPWALVEAQFPELAFAMPQGEVRRRFPEWVLSLPMDVVVGQIPSDLFRVAGLAADLSGIGDFPVPFTPGPPEPDPPGPASPPTAQSAPISTPPVAATPSAPPVVSKPEAAVDRPPQPVVQAPARKPTTPTAGDTGADIPRASAAEAITTTGAPPAAVLVSKPRTSLVAAAPASTENVPAAPRPAAVAEPRSPVLAAPVPAIAPVLETAPASARPSPATDQDSESLAHLVAPGLAPLGAFDWRVWRVAGDRLVSFVPPSLTREPVDTLAAQAATLVQRLASWRIEQMTIRTARLACVLTPLDARAWLAATVRRGGSIAMLELLSVRAVRAGGRSASATPAMTFPAVETTSAGERARHRDVVEAARALAAFGPVTASVAEPDGTAPGVYVFAGGDGTVLAGAARAVYDALVPGHDQEALGQLESVVFRRGRERVVVRPLRGRAGAPAVLATAGEVLLAGRAHRAAAQAAAALERR